MDIKPAEIVMQFMEACEKGDWGTLESLAAEDYRFVIHSLQQNKRELISSQKALWAAFPDIKFNLRVTEVHGNVVKTVYRLTGTHTGLLIPPIPGSFMTIPPTGKKIILAENTAEYTVRNGKVIEQKVGNNPDSGWIGILKQLGIENPYK